ncbi:MAG: Digeranylgeranylglyceryl phosphate synthase [Methanomicrobiales archaeon 53_19]|uniref:geranylgeranylglycerol-phosphate geranylgeranyltransferase n=1 Tax=Methanocalculus sp. TaxID=2004547 RepID=UPI00074A917C|nr:geranylgeranylglycerol-phosphate geranylgeranyltransferase [Methanocalculus sp.]KUK67916.1 MAG: Digeranylgeranylglyceryl phosphate synthase [Methanocalculus sp. 52_23]KUL05240.1 MAG: Digeranylgeranylglyceryl phosphate synthase [Methanomicrobiales archaeon 53_19]HIJ05757.1 geranylgeranylglycerol-phosphate geranylgeranyltransferase [Methanocalculus sp.]
MHLPGIIRIIRPANATISGATAILAYFIATGTVIPEVLLLAAAALLITGAGNTINDACDAAIDAINRPDRPIPSGELSVKTAYLYAALLFILGLSAAFFTNPLCLAIAIINSILLLLYARILKGTVLFGNIAVAYLSGSIFLFGGALAGVDGLIITVPLAGITLFGTLAREIVKDAEDIDGDAAGGATTLPMAIGISRSGTIAFGSAIIAVIVSFIPFLWWGLPYLVGIVILDSAILRSVWPATRCTTPACIRNLKITTQLKYMMYIALLIFLVASTIDIFMPMK